MKTLIAGILTLVTIFSAQAATGPTGPGKTQYEVLENILLNGNTLPSLDKLANVALSGRCFSDNSPNEAVNAGFLIKKQKGFYEAFLYEEVRGDADFFDGMTMQDVIAWNPMIKSVEIDKSFFAVSRPNGFSNFEQSGEYLVEEQITFVKISGRLANKWVTTGHCYYLIPKNK